VTKGNKVQLLMDAEQAYPAMEQAIRTAKHHLHVLFYIWRSDETGRDFRDLLIERAKAGVQVRVLCDSVGTLRLRRNFMKPLGEAGAQVEFFSPMRIFTLQPLLNFRNHRKILIADGRVSFIGGLNIGDEYKHAWHDAAMLLCGPGVDQLQEVFADDWYFTTDENLAQQEFFGQWETADSAVWSKELVDSSKGSSCKVYEPVENAECDVVASGPDTRHNNMHDAFFVAITAAKKRIFITTPYFIPDHTILTALRMAVYRGVEVRLLVPKVPDHWLVKLASRSYYPYLLESGVRVFEYDNGFLHSKLAVFDDDTAVVGSANMDIRSFRLNFEISCFMRNEQLAGQLIDVYNNDLAHSQEVALAEVRSRNYLSQLADSTAQLLSPLL